MSRHTTTGNDRPHIVAEGYLDRSRFDVPLTRDDDCPGVMGWVFASLVVAIIIGLSWAGVS